MALYTRCPSCGSRARVEILGPPVVMPRNGLYCAVCGARAAVSQDSDQDYWYTLAEALSLGTDAAAADVAKQLYESWEAWNAGFQRFVDFVRDLEGEGVDAASELS